MRGACLAAAGHQALRAAKGLGVDPVANDRAASVRSTFRMAEVCHCRTNFVEDQDVARLHVQVQNRAAVHVGQAKEELLKKGQERVLSRRCAFQSLVLESAGHVVQALGSPLEDQSWPSVRARENGEASNDVWVLADGPQNGEFLRHVELACGSPLHRISQPSTRGYLQGHRLAPERPYKDAGSCSTPDLFQVANGFSQRPRPGVVGQLSLLAVGLHVLLLSNGHGLGLRIALSSFLFRLELQLLPALGRSESLCLGTVVLVGLLCQGPEAVSNVLALFVVPESRTV